MGARRDRLDRIAHLGVTESRAVPTIIHLEANGGRKTSQTDRKRGVKTDMSDSLKQRGDALENMFFLEKDRALLQKIKADMESKEACKALAAVIGINDQVVVDGLVSVGVSAESLTSVSLIPLVAVAWSDGRIDEKERKAVLKAASDSGLLEGSAAYELLNSWLAVKPDDDLLDCWKKYVAALKESLDGPSFSQLKTTVLSRARNVAEAAGGFLGMMSISASEERVLGELENAF